MYYHSECIGRVVQTTVYIIDDVLQRMTGLK